VAVDPVGPVVRDRHLVDAREYAHAFAQRDDRGGVGADIAQMRAAHRQEAALLVERQLDLSDEVAALIIAEKRLAALAYPLHRPADPLRRPQNQREFRKDRVLGSEVSTDLVRHDANLLGLNPEDGGDFALLTHDTAAAGVQEIATGLLVVAADSGARLHGAGRAPAAPRFRASRRAPH